MSFNNKLEGFNACQTMWFRWWNPNGGHFSTNEPCHEAIGNHFSCYAQGVALQAVGDSAMAYPDLTLPIVDAAVKSCLRYRNPKRGAYSVSFSGGINSGDDDICYDDNGHLLRGLLAIYEATHNENYLTMAREIMDFLYTGVVEHNEWHIKGLLWHMTKQYMSTISNSVAAIGAMVMTKHARSEDEKAKLYAFAKLCLEFVWAKLKDSDDVIMDGVGRDNSCIDVTKYSYNQGTTLNGYCQLYKFSGEKEWLDRATVLANAATDRGKTLFDRDYKDYNKRFFHGNLYFGQLLIEGLAAYVDICGENGPRDTVDRCRDEIKRHLSYLRKYVFDTRDNLYFGSFDIYTLDEMCYRKYRNEFHGDKPFKPDPIERRKNMDSTPVDQRPVAKSVIFQGAAAHAFFSGALVCPEMDPVDV